MNFTLDIKREILSARRHKPTGLAAKAALAAFLHTSGTVGVVNGNASFFIVSETENVAELFMRLFFETFERELAITHATRDKKSGKGKLVLQCQSDTASILTHLGLLKRGGKDFRTGIANTLINTEESKIGYIKGAFLGGGSCTLPTGKNVGYHLEIVFSDKKTAQDFCDLLAEFELIAKWIERKETYVVYVKSKELISDFLALVGAENCLKKFNTFVERRDVANQDNRAKNCFAGNADKTAIASVKQVVAIRKIQEQTRFLDLSEDLCALARARLKYPQMSLKELSENLGVSKSCLNHRMRKLMEIAEEL
jgi:DNA-binding protein WhiA